MSQAATLLAGLTEDTSAYSSSETHIVIGNDRFITVPESLKRLAVQYDHDVETVTFDCPRFWDEHDMSQMTPYINYLLPNGTTGQYKAENVSSDSSRMYFDWTISNNVTQYNGKLSFLVCIKKTDKEGNESNHWNSELNQDCYISAGLECAQTNITKYPDIITQLLTRMDAFEGTIAPEALQAYINTWLDENRESILDGIDLPSGDVWETIVDYTVPEDCAQVKLTTDVNGNPFSLKKAVALFRFHPTTTVEGLGYVRVNFDASVDHVYSNKGSLHEGVTIPKNEGEYTFYRVMLEKNNEGITAMPRVSVGAQTDNTIVMLKTYQGFYENYDPTTLTPFPQGITAISAGCFGVAIGAGTRIKLLGVRE